MAKEKKGKGKKEKVERRFVVGLHPVYNCPRPRRANKAISLLKDFAFKHFRVSRENVLISNAVNQFVWQRGRQHVPRKIEIKVVFSEGKANIFLKGEKVVVPKEEKKEEKEEKKTAEEKATLEERERKKEEKKLAEKAAEKVAIKRGKE